MLILAASVLFALSISALCSLLEAAVLSLSPGQVDDLARRSPGVGAIWQGFKAQIQKPIAVILILNTAAHTIGATIAGAAFEDQFGVAGLVWFSLLFTYVMLQFTEILPKTMGVRYARQLAPMIARPLAMLVRLLSPVLWFIHLVNKPFERRKSKHGHDSNTLDEIAALARMARLGGLLGEHQERIIRGASRLSNLTTENVMIPAKDVAFLSNSQTLFDALIAAHNDPHTRFPIHEADDKNQVLGYVNFKEMIYWSRTNPQDPGFRGIIRPVHFVKPNVSAAQLLKVFVDQHEHMAIVQNDAGETLGLITLEDLIEELVGELEDEFDRLPRMLHRLSGGVWMVGGGVLMSELAMQLQEPKLAEPGTVGAYLLRQLGPQPKLADRLTSHGWDFLVRRLRRGKVFEVSVMPVASASQRPL